MRRGDMASTGASHGNRKRAHVAISRARRHGVVVSEVDGANLQPAEPGKGITGDGMRMRKDACVCGRRRAAEPQAREGSRAR